ncbi:nitroreductase family protein [Hydrocarboniclastica marina]|uniref:Putative NAD(P)H nitroreductase n=1 Tax=Hydrocarboniclastica marina TaxID=2259620 RepID=A0A4P7XHX1_9ALTE|nr:nitroreductase [Hydrocarboniclastica marina]MAL98384.1 nitroreductase [Alteromonadaceae bacterium]QCF25852.1 nitroreductase [Hydrocarboniclastica marina]|tara:strand:+ start:5754 stop:6332 length:579 start_codon:yes stop_codon:yes gene_type:complete
MRINDEDLLAFINGRRSTAKVVAPAPGRAELEAMLRCAMRAPDHAMLRPWRYIVLEGRALTQLGEAWAAAVAKDQPSSEPKAIEKARGLPLRAPMVVVAVTKVVDHPKVPAIEQQMSTASGVAYFLLALQARGFGGFWRTGAMAYHPRIRQFFELSPNESITGFIYVGTPKPAKEAPPSAELADHLQYWRPD